MSTVVFVCCEKIVFCKKSQLSHTMAHQSTSVSYYYNRVIDGSCFFNVCYTDKSSIEHQMPVVRHTVALTLFNY